MLRFNGGVLSGVLILFKIDIVECCCVLFFELGVWNFKECCVCIVIFWIVGMGV